MNSSYTVKIQQLSISPNSTDFSNDEHDTVHKVSWQERRCYDNTLQVRIGNVKAVALVDTGATKVVCYMLCSLRYNQARFSISKAI